MLRLQPGRSADKLPLYHPLRDLIPADDLLRYAQYHAGCCGDDVHHAHDRGRDDGLHDRGRDDGLHDHDGGRGHGDGLHGHDDDRDHDDAHQDFPLPHHLLSPYCVFL